MSIKNRLTLLFSSLVIAILILFSICIYYFSSNAREDQFYHRLRNRALNNARHQIQAEGATAELFKTLDRNTVTTMNHSKVVIFDENFHIIYSNPENEPLTCPNSAQLKQLLIDRKDLHYKDGAKDVIAIVFNESSRPFVVVAGGFDEDGFNDLNNLQLILLIGLIVAGGVITATGYLFASQALRPISKIVDEVDSITATNLNLRLNEGNGKDEVAQLAIKFNKMLQRLETAFELQSSFISNASHELRTPLTSIGGQIEIALMNKSIPIELEQVLQSTWEDIKNMNQLTEGLLNLAQASLDVSKIKLCPLRIDETLWHAREELLKIRPNYLIQIDYKEMPEDEKSLTINGNEHLLQNAFLNLMDNACKYSADNKVQVEIIALPSSVQILFKDNGIGISESDLAYIFESFYRAPNARAYSGHGIGLALSKKIILLNRGSIQIYSTLGKGTTVDVVLPLT